MEKKHFSHPHYLNLHQIPHGSEIRCSGCKQPAGSGSGSVYSCWQCSFFLHDQCFQASRSLNHSSHPTHPLTLSPSPTYPSASFFCNFCNQSGDGFSYTCAHCDFDLHIHCALAVNYHNPQHHYPPPPHPLPNFSSYPPSPQTHHPNPHPLPNHPPNFNSYPPSPQTHEPYPNPPPPPPVIDHNLPNPAPPQYSYNPQSGLYEPIFNGPNPGNPVPTAPVPNLNTQLCPQTTNGHNLQQFLPNQFPPIVQNMPCSHQSPPPNQPNFNPQFHNPTPPAPTPTPNVQVGSGGGLKSDPPGNQQKLQGVKHFSHKHPLLFSEIRTQDNKICSGCEDKISGLAYICTETNCNFQLHNSCFGLPIEIQHDSHPNHRLALLSSPPYKEGDGFACDACMCSGKAFTYHCATCTLDLHVDCAFLPASVRREDHEHPLTLYYKFPYRKEKEEDPEPVFSCDACRGVVDSRGWMYCCTQCDFGTHLGCVAAKASPPPQEEESSSSQLSELKSALEIQAQMQRMQLELQMAQQTAQLIASMGQSVANLF